MHYPNFAKALMEKQVYPELKDGAGNPISPYDVTAHTLPLMMDLKVDEIRVPFKPNWLNRVKVDALALECPPHELGVRLFKSHTPSMDEGWTRWLLTETSCLNFRNVGPKEIAANGLTGSGSAVIFPDQAPNQILNGYPKGSMPDEYTGGVGKKGVENLKKFVEAGGTLVFLNRASNFAIEQFNLPIRDVTKGLLRKDFYIPGSILRTELDLTHPVAKGMPQQSIAWFENGPAFEFVGPQAAGLPVSTTPSAEAAATPPNQGGEPKNYRVVARYPSDAKNVLLSGWALGAEKIAGKAALVEVRMGKGKIILFGFRPQYRGQSLATFPLLFNSISN